MSDSSKKPASVAAFLFMPQLGLSWQHSSFIVPVFIRTIAMMFVQAGLLPLNHPAARYGMEGIKKYKFFELMSEAWYNLRATHASPYQWGLFASVALMVVMVVLSLVVAVLNIASVLVSSASAQIFDGMLGATNSASIPGGPVLKMFDKVVPAPGTAHGEWGIMILDKMLRAGAEGKGGLLQQAFGSLMQIYNTGILVIAGIMVFWLILYVVTDTAKTGMIGGQRHNMVWAPIRIVFALGLMIPLGANGFSSGQFMVMKLAEWGSNFGSRGWYTYVSTIVADQAVLAKFGQASPTDLMSQYAQMYICRTAYNGYANASGALAGNDDQLITTYRRINNVLTPGRSQFFFTNATVKNLCGSADFPAKDTKLINDLLASSWAVDRAIGKYQNDLAQGYFNLFFAGGAGGSVWTNDDGVVAPIARKFSCSFTSQFIYPGIGEPNPLTNLGNAGGFLGGVIGFFGGGSTPTICSDGELNQCGFGPPGSGKMGDTSCISDMIAAYNGTMQTILKNGDALLTTELTKNASMLTDVKNQGWPGMGVWYHNIESMNDVVGMLHQPGLSFTRGDMSSLQGTKIGEKVAEVLGQYRPWWITQAASAPSSLPAGSEVLTSDWATSDIAVNNGTSDLKGVLEGAQDARPDAFSGAMLEMAGGAAVSRFFLDMADPADVDTYPLAKLAKLGGSLQLISLVIYGGIALLEIVGAGLAGAVGGNAVAAFFGGGALPAMVSAFIQGPVTAVITTFAGILFAASLVLMYYVPMIPFVRVAYAVFTWMVSVFEAVVMVPIAALSFLNTEGEGMGARHAWVLWLNVLLRPILTVIGFVGALLLFNTFVVWIGEAFSWFMQRSFPRGAGNGIFGPLAFCIIYVFIIYTVANSCFKLLDMIPAAMFKWLPGASADHSFDDDGAKGVLSPASKFGDAINMSRTGQGKAPAPGPTAAQEAARKDEVSRLRQT